MYKRVIKEPNASSVITGGKEEAIDLGTRVFVDGGEELRNFCQVASIWFVKLKKKGGSSTKSWGLGRHGKFVKGLTYAVRRGRVVFLCGIHAAMRIFSSTHQM